MLWLDHKCGNRWKAESEASSLPLPLTSLLDPSTLSFCLSSPCYILHLHPVMFRPPLKLHLLPSSSFRFWFWTLCCYPMTFWRPPFWDHYSRDLSLTLLSSPHPCRVWHLWLLSSGWPSAPSSETSSHALCSLWPCTLIFPGPSLRQ